MVINSQNKKKLQIVLLVVIAVVALGIGYASITAINLIINGNATANVNQNNFRVKFLNEQGVTPTIEGAPTNTISVDSDTTASFNISTLNGAGQSVIATYKIKNESVGIGASIGLQLTSSNSEYFRVVETVADTELQAGDETTATVRVEMIKTPITDSVTTTVTATLIATPLENAQATGGSPASKASDDPVSFATDSWKTIQTAVRNNNTSLYNVGDTKTVVINGINYTVRLVNKSTDPNCSNTNYSETACGFVMEFADIVELRAMNSTNTNAGGWPASEMHTYLQGSFFNSLPNDLKSAIKPTRVVSSYGCISNERPCLNPDNNGNNFISIDNIYLLSAVEIHGVDSNDTAASTTTQLDYYQGMSKEILSCSWYPGCQNTRYPRAIKQYQGTDNHYWLRSAYSDDDNFYTINYKGIIGCQYTNDNSYGLAPAFRIG